MTLGVRIGNIQLDLYSAPAFPRPVAAVPAHNSACIFVSLPLGSTTVVWVCLRTREFQFAP